MAPLPGQHRGDSELQARGPRDRVPPVPGQRTTWILGQVCRFCRSPSPSPAAGPTLPDGHHALWPLSLPAASLLPHPTFHGCLETGVVSIKLTGLRMRAVAGNRKVSHPEEEKTDVSAGIGLKT